MNSTEIRSRFIQYFERHGHIHTPAASLVPNADTSVLFTVAGMQQFKNFYQHPELSPSKRLVTIQPCIRTVDIDEVGDDTHCTVFEMLGNFSFGFTGEESSEAGPYFKTTAITLAWQFLTQELAIAPNCIRATYFGGDDKRARDEESRQILESLDGLSLVEAQGDDNFWGPVGDEGPCGPTVEFYIDNIEVWNNVFNEYYRDPSGHYSRLEFQGVDTGMGLERLASILQQKLSVYETDLLSSLIDIVKAEAYNYDDRHSRIIADHVKASLFLLTDGIRPGNKGRDYIVRRLIRRAVRAAGLIGFQSFDKLLNECVALYSQHYESIGRKNQEAIEIFLAERNKFLKTLQSGINQLEKLLRMNTHGEISGEQAFKLLDTYGFPIELTREIAEEANWTVDLSGFEDLFAKHREQSRAGMDKIFKGGLADDDPKTVAHHTAHHLLLAALRQVLGDHVVQRGSNVTSERLRIDISHPDRISEEKLQMVESLVNQKIEEDLPVISEIMDRDEAYRLGTLAEFGAKYPSKACVYTIIDQSGEAFSREFCGGPHVTHTGELGRFEILKEEASSSGVRRLRARVVPK